jgi:hypothetical protein
MYLPRESLPHPMPERTKQMQREAELRRQQLNGFDIHIDLFLLQGVTYRAKLPSRVRFCSARFTTNGIAQTCLLALSFSFAVRC